MKTIRFVSVVLVIVSIVGLIGSLVVPNGYRDRAVYAQIIQVNAADALMGEAGTKIGSPKKLIIDDPKAFLPGEMDGAKLGSQNYLDTHKIYPLQLQTVEAVGSIATGVSIAAAIVFGLVALFATRRLKRQ